MLAEAARVLRPGGLFLSGEWERWPSFNNNPNIGDRILGIDRLVNVVDSLLIQNYALYIPTWLDESAQFQDITVQSFSVPIGDWPSDPDQRALGKYFRSVCVQYVDSLKPLLGEPRSGLNVVQINDLILGYLDNIYNVPGIVGKYHTVHAKKI
jgi:hypothetical protein